MRRNLSTYDRSALVLKLEPLYAAEAKRRSGERTDLRQISDEGSYGRTDEQLAKLAVKSGEKSPATIWVALSQEATQKAMAT